MADSPSTSVVAGLQTYLTTAACSLLSSRYRVSSPTWSSAALSTSSISISLQGRTGTVRRNYRQVLNTKKRGPSGFITFLSRSRSSSQPFCRLPASLWAGVRYTPSLAMRSAMQWPS